MATTFDVLLENQPIINELMSKINFVEVSRFATGGLHSSPSLLITYEGDEKDYHERGYIMRPGNYDYYFSIKYPNGTIFNSLEQFIDDYKNHPKYEYKEIQL